MSVDRYDPTPIFRQIANLLREQIRTGELEPMDTLPSENALVQIHGVARETVRDAMRLLREEGWVFTIQARGSFVSPRERWPEQPAEE